jgi:DNA-binding NtrC family response regulator
MLLRTEGLSNVVPVADPRTLLDRLEAEPASVILLDLFMPHVSGYDLLEAIARDFPGVPVIVATGSDRLDSAVRCMRRGAFDYLVKPVEPDQLIPSLQRALERHSLIEETRRTRDKILSPVLEQPELFEPFVTRSPAMFTIFRYVEAIADLPHSVLITGETGVGKELLARIIHDASGREGAFVPVNVAGLDDTLFSDTLFGHAKGAYTSAVGAREGMILRARDGTLFLDEIGDLSMPSQVKLLRLLQDGEFQALGSDVTNRTTARIIASTNADLDALQADGSFRRDLFYRLNAYHISIPPLRQRREDIPLLVDHYINEFAHESGQSMFRMPADALSRLQSYRFPGNVRELRSVVLDVIAKDHLDVRPLDAVGQKLKISPSEATGDPNGDIVFPAMLPSLRDVTDLLVEEAMRRTEGNMSAAARLLGVTQQAISKRWKSISQS